MRSARLCIPLVIAAGLLAGCSSEGGEGAPIPQRQATSPEQIQSLPPQARTAAENAQKAGDFQSQRMREMAEAQRKSQGGG